MSFRPLHGRILVRRVEPEEKTKGGIIIPPAIPAGAAWISKRSIGLASTPEAGSLRSTT
jgi:chaperonin GroES